MNAERSLIGIVLMLGIAVVAILSIFIVSSLEPRVDVECARFWKDIPTAPMFSRQETPSLWPVWDGFGGYAFEWGHHEYVEGWVDLGNDQAYEINLIIPDSEGAADWFWAASSVQETWDEMRELAQAEYINPDLNPFTADELEKAKSWSWVYPMPVWSWVVTLDLPGSNDPVVLGPFFRVGCREYGDNWVAFPNFEPKFYDDEPTDVHN